jgi:hypothetical protein
MIISDEMKAKAIDQAREFLKDHDNEWADHWDAVMINDEDGYDINIWQEGADEPLSIVVYEVKDNNINYDNALNITQEVLA